MAFWLGTQWIECNVQQCVCRIKWDSRPSGPTLGGSMETKIWMGEELKRTEPPEYVHRRTHVELNFCHGANLYLHGGGFWALR